jgi:hypothetical protein
LAVAIRAVSCRTAKILILKLSSDQLVLFHFELFDFDLDVHQLFHIHKGWRDLWLLLLVVGRTGLAPVLPVVYGVGLEWSRGEFLC